MLAVQKELICGLISNPVRNCADQEGLVRGSRHKGYLGIVIGGYQMLRDCEQGGKQSQ